MSEGPTRLTVRGGRDQFDWAKVKDDKHYQNYLGHSLKAPVGRWQAHKDLEWFSRSKADSTEGHEERARTRDEERKEEIKAIKRAEEEAVAQALGITLPSVVGHAASTGTNSIAVTNPKIAAPGDNDSKERNGDAEEGHRRSRHGHRSSRRADGRSRSRDRYSGQKHRASRRRDRSPSSDHGRRRSTRKSNSRSRDREYHRSSRQNRRNSPRPQERHRDRPELRSSRRHTREESRHRQRSHSRSRDRDQKGPCDSRGGGSDPETRKEQSKAVEEKSHDPTVTNS